MRSAPGEGRGDDGWVRETLVDLAKLGHQLTDFYSQLSRTTTLIEFPSQYYSVAIIDVLREQIEPNVDTGVVVTPTYALMPLPGNVVDRYCIIQTKEPPVSYPFHWDAYQKSSFGVERFPGLDDFLSAFSHSTYIPVAFPPVVVHDNYYDANIPHPCSPFTTMYDWIYNPENPDAPPSAPLLAARKVRHGVVIACSGK